MLSGRFNQKPSDRWIGGAPGPEDRDSAFNIMSPTGRNRPFKGIILPSKRMGTMTWENNAHPTSISNMISGNNHSRDQNRHAWGAVSDEHFGIHVPAESDGIAFVYNKGPAGQTPFPTLIAMPGYFPQGKHDLSNLSPTPQSLPSDQQQPPVVYPVSSQDYAQPLLDSLVHSVTGSSSRSHQQQQDPEFWDPAQSRPESQTS
ncbi:hypothetical protein BGZ83_001291 [Gryganskiella cystojenkinii]|nr:hypothetical protein BGZ83_001291 [Gryganskiella cystojenkinii]